MPYYLLKNQAGLTEVAAGNDGYSMEIHWTTAYPSVKTNKIAYHIYYSTLRETVFTEGVKFIALQGTNQAVINDFVPGDTYWFAVRAVEYDVTVTNIATLIDYTTGLYVYPKTMLSADITSSDTSIPVIDASVFPSYGVVRIGQELVRYSSVTPTTLELLNSLYRGYSSTTASIHNTDGYDGTAIRDTEVVLFLGDEEPNTKIFQAQCRFDLDHWAYTKADGYHQRTADLVHTDLTSSDEYNVNFPSYDYAGWHRTDPVQLLNGECVGSYIGGEQYCADGYTGVGRTLRGLSVQEQNNQRQEMLLSVTGQPVVLVKRMTRGITCSCYRPSSENPDDRCPRCFGTGFVVGWEQYFNPRRSDGRIMVRFSPVDDKVKLLEAGLEPDAQLDCWTLTVPTIRDRDLIIRFDQDGNEEFRYEVLGTTRNVMLQSLMGGQKFRVQRIRKTDALYQVRAFKNTAKLPSKLNTSISSVNPGILPHSHIIVINENITNVSQINQTTSVAGGHSHVIIDGVVQETLGHAHEIILP